MPQLPTSLDRMIDTPRGRLFTRDWTPAAPRAAAPILLFHDSLGSVELWRDFPAALAAATGRRVLAYDRLGFGRSDPYPGVLDAGFVADEAVRHLPLLRAQLGVTDFVAMGHSVGGAMAAVCAAREPGTCRALVTESAQAFVEDLTLAGIAQAKAGFAAPGQIERLARYHGDKASWVLAAWTETWLSPTFRGWNLDAELPRVACPALVLHGERDQYGTAAQPRRYVAGIGPGARMDLLRGLRHVPHKEDPAQVLGRVAAFLSPLP